MNIFVEINKFKINFIKLLNEHEFNYTSRLALYVLDYYFLKFFCNSVLVLFFLKTFVLDLKQMTYFFLFKIF